MKNVLITIIALCLLSACKLIPPGHDSNGPANSENAPRHNKHGDGPGNSENAPGHNKKNQY